MLFRTYVRERAVALLRQADTLAGRHVYSSRAKKQQPGNAPILLVYTEHENGTLKSRAAPSWTMTLTLAIDAIIEGIAEAEAEPMLDAIEEQVRNALLTDPRFVSMKDVEGRNLIEQFGELVCAQDYDASGDRIVATARIALGLQYTDAYPQVIDDDLRVIAWNVDLGRPFDPLGAYDPKLPPPRLTGPDGRIEVAGTIYLPALTPTDP